VLLASLGMGAAMIAALAWGRHMELTSWALVLAAGVTGAVIYLFAGRLLGIREIGRFFGALVRPT
jgi:hypothetical protein